MRQIVIAHSPQDLYNTTQKKQVVFHLSTSFVSNVNERLWCSKVPHSSEDLMELSCMSHLRNSFDFSAKIL